VTRAANLILAGLALSMSSAAGGGAKASPLRVPPSPGAAQAALAQARAEDEVVLLPGVHPGPLLLDRAVRLRGEPGAVVDGGGEGSVVTVTASGAVVEDLEIRRSGRRVLSSDAGIKVESASGVTLRNLRMRDVLYGVYAERGEHLVVDGCRLTGTVTPGEGGDGNGIHLWYTHDVWLHADTVERFEDAVYLSFAYRTRVEGCRFQDSGRYGFHTMYSQDAHLASSVFTRNQAGCALMFSNGLDVIGNDFLHNRGPRTYGLLLNSCSTGEFRDNRLIDNTIGIFMDNSNRNRLEGNLLQDNGWGLLLFSSCAGNVLTGNTFLNNDYAVSLDMRRTDNRFDDGARGNYWSQNAPYDLDGDGISDTPYSPVSAFAFLSKQYPDLAILAASPGVTALTMAERVFPALRPSAAVDRFPLVAPASMRTGAVAPGSGRAGEAGARGHAEAGPAGRAEAGSGPRSSLTAALGFGALLLAGAAGLAWRWRR
jgi:nitrous oxidase accessory protein